MTRDERINSALLPILEKMREHGATDEMCKMYDNGFHVGAMWADAHPHGISVEDELPKDDVYVATIDKFGLQEVRYYFRGKWYSSFGNEYGSITHWMPLPQPPKRKAMKGNDKIKVVKETIDWEMRRFEIAKAVLSNPAFIRTDEYEGISAFHVDYSVKTAIKVADTLIKKLKGGEE